MTRTALALTALILILQLATLAKTERVRVPVHTCEARLAQFIPQPFEGKGTLPAEFVEPISPEETLITGDWRTK